MIEHGGGVVAGYREKPVLEYSASMGIYIYEPRAIAALPDGPCQFPDLVISLLEQGEQVAAYETRQAWFHIGTFEQHVEATKLLGDD